MNKDRFLQRRVEFDHTGGLRGVFDHAGASCIKFSFERDVDPVRDGFLEIVIENNNGEIVAEIDSVKVENPDRIRIRFTRPDERHGAVAFLKFMLRALDECA